MPGETNLEKIGEASPEIGSQAEASSADFGEPVVRRVAVFGSVERRKPSAPREPEAFRDFGPFPSQAHTWAD